MSRLCLTVLFLAFPFTGRSVAALLDAGLAGRHPRILFTQEEADSLGVFARQHLADNWAFNREQVDEFRYPFLDSAGTQLRGQRMWWRLSRLAIHTALSRDSALVDSCRGWFNLLTADDWKYEEDYTITLGGAHLIAAYALAYDCIYNDLSDTERVAGRQRIAAAIDSLQVHGFDNKDYWTYDMQNNHMHFRLTAFLYCILAVEDEADVEPAADRARTLFSNLSVALPPDGSNHEGIGYMQYGSQMLFPALYALQRCTDMTPVAASHFVNAGYHYLYHVTPGYRHAFGFGDTGNNACSHPQFIFQVARRTADPHLQYFARQLRAHNPDDFWATQWLLLSRDPALPASLPDDLPRHRFFYDPGILICRDGWDSSATAAAFKCGPMGGRLLARSKSTAVKPFYNEDDWYNVAHDDPDAGTFLLYTRGAFITTGDGYEKQAKVTTQHSTFIVDDEAQAGGGSGWSQPPAFHRHAVVADYGTAGDHVVFNGNMKGVYSNMRSLMRTFVSRRARYFVLYDDAVSNTTSGRTFESRFQTTGTLDSLTRNTWRITSGDASALFRIWAPDTLGWSADTNKIGTILRARQTDVTRSRFLVMVCPNTDSIDPGIRSIDSDSVLGVKVPAGTSDEYTLLSRDPAITHTVDSLSFAASCLLATLENGNLRNAVLANGRELTVSGTAWIKSDNYITASIESVATDRTGLSLTVKASTASDTASGAGLRLGGFQADTDYALLTDYTDASTITTDSSGTCSLYVTLDRSHVLGFGSLAGIRDATPSPRPEPILAIVYRPGQVIFNTRGETAARIRIYDAAGRMITVLGTIPAAGGCRTVWRIPAETVPGIYLVRTGAATGRFVVTPTP